MLERLGNNRIRIVVMTMERLMRHYCNFIKTDWREPKGFVAGRCAMPRS
jgi:hypothetical protein